MRAVVVVVRKSIDVMAGMCILVVVLVLMRDVYERVGFLCGDIYHERLPG